LTFVFFSVSSFAVTTHTISDNSAGSLH